MSIEYQSCPENPVNLNHSQAKYPLIQRLRDYWDYDVKEHAVFYLKLSTLALLPPTLLFITGYKTIDAISSGAPFWNTAAWTIGAGISILLTYVEVVGGKILYENIRQYS